MEKSKRIQEAEAQMRKAQELYNLGRLETLYFRKRVSRLQVESNNKDLTDYDEINAEMQMLNHNYMLAYLAIQAEEELRSALEKYFDEYANVLVDEWGVKNEWGDDDFIDNISLLRSKIV